MPMSSGEAQRPGLDSADSEIEVLRQLDRAILLPHGRMMSINHDKSAGFRQGPHVSPLGTVTGGPVQTRS